MQTILKVSFMQNLHEIVIFKCIVVITIILIIASDCGAGRDHSGVAS